MVSEKFKKNLYYQLKDNPEVAYERLYKRLSKQLVYKYGVDPKNLKKIFSYGARKSTGDNCYFINNDFKNTVYQSLGSKDKLHCAECGDMDMSHLTIHHMNYKSMAPWLKYDKDNVVLMCGHCHRVEHDLVKEGAY